MAYVNKILRRELIWYKDVSENTAYLIFLNDFVAFLGSKNVKIKTEFFVGLIHNGMGYKKNLV